MIRFEGLLEGPVAEAIGWALFHSLWQGALIALILFAVLRQLSGQTANLRYLVSICALALLVVLPLATAIGAFRSDELRRPHERATAMQVEEPHRLNFVVARNETVPSGWLTTARSFAGANLKTIVVLWAIGVAFLSGRLILGWLRIRKLLVENERAPERLMQTLNSLADRLEIWTSIRLVQSRLVEVPMVIGWLEPVVLLPVTALTGLTPQQLETILAHELAHVRRHDFLFNFGQTMIETLLFYHPATWWISRQVRIERENSCDDLAVAVCGNPLVYARALASLEQGRSTSALGIAASGGSLLTRVRRLVSAPESKCASGWIGRLSAVMMAGALLIGAPLTMFAVNEETIDAGHGTSVTVSASAIPVERAIVVEPVAPVEHAHVAEMMTYPNAPLFEVEAVDPIEPVPPLVFAELDELGELFRLEDLSNGSIQIALFEIDQSEERDTPTSGGKRQLTVDELIELKQSGITPAYVDSMHKAGLGVLTTKELRSMKAHGITADYARAMAQSGLEGLNSKTILSLKVHGATPEMAKGLRESVAFEIDAADVIKAAIHGLKPEWVARMKASGLAGNGLDELVSLRIHGVTPELVEEISALGLADFSVDAVKRMAIHGADPKYIRQMKDAGYRRLSAEQIIRFRIHGVSPSFISGMARLGYSNIEGNDLIRMKIHGVTEGWVEGLQQAGYPRVSVDELVRLRIAGVSKSDLRVR